MTSVIEQEHFLMFGRMRDWAGVGAVFAGLALGVSAAPGYLPAVGPVPLRFRLAAQPDTHLLLMPLPPPDLPPPAPSIPSAPPAGTNTEAQKTPTATAPSSAAALSASSGSGRAGRKPRRSRADGLPANAHAVTSAGQPTARRQGSWRRSTSRRRRPRPNPARRLIPPTPNRPATA